MNIKELIALLQTFDPALEVVVSGYEGGTTPAETENIGVFWVDKATGSPYGGPYGDPKPGETGMENPAHVLLISR